MRVWLVPSSSEIRRGFHYPQLSGTHPLLSECGCQTQQARSVVMPSSKNSTAASCIAIKEQTSDVGEVDAIRKSVNLWVKPYTFSVILTSPGFRVRVCTGRTESPLNHPFCFSQQNLALYLGLFPPQLRIILLQWRPRPSRNSPTSWLIFWSTMSFSMETSNWALSTNSAGILWYGKLRKN